MVYNKRVPTIDDLRNVYRDKGYRLSTSYRKLTITGWRSKDTVLDRFNDFISIYYNEDREYFKVFEATTLPGRHWLVEKLLNKRGTAILAPGEYLNCYAIGKHQDKYSALVQRGAVKVFRDGNRDEKFDFDPYNSEKGFFGINIHQANGEPKIGRNSAGCQVIRHTEDFAEFMYQCAVHADKWGNKFSYTLVEY